MALPNHVKYQMALNKVLVEGSWLIDPENGLVLSRDGKPLGSINHGGYVVLSMRVPSTVNSNILVTAHRLIWSYVNGIPSTDDQINHINGIKVDNRISNLELVSAKANLIHAYQLGLKQGRPGEKHHNVRLSKEDVLQVRQLAKEGVKQVRLAEAFEVSRSTINDIVLRKRWKHI